MLDSRLRTLVETANAAFNMVARASRISRRGYMVLSDLCDSTKVASRDLQAGTALQAAHEALCAQASDRAVNSPHFKSLGDGIMIEVATAVEACRIALQLIEASKELRLRAERNDVRPEFADFALKVVVASDEFFPAPDTQRWLGLLPTKAARLASYANRDQVWIDSVVSEAIEPFLPALKAEFNEKLMRGATFNVPLKGFRDPCRIDELCLDRQPAPRIQERGKELCLTWPDVIDAVKWLVRQIQTSRFRPRHVVAMGRSGAILGGIIAADLASAEGHVPIHICDQARLPNGSKRLISTLTESPEIYAGSRLIQRSHPSTPAWDPGPVLVVIGEAKNDEPFECARAWLDLRGITEVKTLALVRSREARPDFFRFEAQDPLLPWQFSAEHDVEHPVMALSAAAGGNA